MFSEDVDLQYLAVRRPLIEWALRRAVAEEPGIRVLDGANVSGVIVVDGRVTGVDVEGANLGVELLVDALGRRTAAPGWLENCGIPMGGVEMTDCSVIYYCRY